MAIGLALVFIVLNVADILLTWQCLRLGAIELNFFMNSVLALGFFPSILFRLGISSGLAAIMLYRGWLTWLIIAVIGFIFVCVNNVATLTSLS